MKQFTSIHYADGSANRYLFRSDGHFEYDPVRIEQSSTGMYSGGEPRAGRLDAAQLARLVELVGALEANTKLHVEDRGKGTGMFHLRDEGGERRFIIARGPELLAFDEFAGALR